MTIPRRPGTGRYSHPIIEVGPRVVSVPPVAPEVTPAQPLRVESAQPQSTRSMSPPGNVRFSGPWGVQFSGPGPVFLLGLLVVAVLAAVVYFVRGEVRSIRDELAALEGRAKARDEATQRQVTELRSHVQALQLYTQQSVGLTAQVVQRLGGKLDFPPGGEPTDPGWHQPPLRVGAPPVQPRATLPAAPPMPVPP